MFTRIFSRFPVNLTRIVIVLVLLPTVSWMQNNPHLQPAPDNSLLGIAPGWTASEWNEVMRIIRLDQFADHALMADQWEQRIKLIPLDEPNAMSFGYSVAMDGSTLVIGAPGGRFWDDEKSQYYYCGAAYVFERSASGWSSVHLSGILYPEDYTQADSFGYAVAIDSGTIVVGDPDGVKPYVGISGAAYVFMHTTEGWEQTAKLTELSPVTGDIPRFGISVDIDDDLIVIGAPDENLFYDGFWHDQQGSVYVFQMPVGGWPGMEAHESGFLRPTDGRSADSFGFSVAVSGHTVIAGAYAHEPDPGDPDETAYGKAYIFSQNDPWGNANEVASFTASDAADHEYFGWAVDIDGDLAAVGAMSEYAFDKNGEESVYLFERPEAGWSGAYTETARLVASDDNKVNDFGYSVAVSGSTVLAGARGWNPGGIWPDTGAAYVFIKPQGGWVDMMTETQRLLAADHQDSDRFGFDLAIDGTTIAVGAPWKNGSIGAAYVFDSAPENWLDIFIPVMLK